MKKFFEKVKYKLYGVGTVATIAWFGSLFARLPKIFERVQYLTGWEAIGVFIVSIFVGLMLLAIFALFAWLFSTVFEDTFEVDDYEQCNS